MSVLANENAALRAEVADLRGRLARALADCGHLKARLSIQSERMWAGDHRGLDALLASDRPTARNPRRDFTGFCPGGRL